MPYEGVATEAERAEALRLCLTVSPAIRIFLRAFNVWFPQPDAEHVGRISDDVLEARIGGVDARIPWSAMLGYVASPGLIVLIAGTRLVLIARSFVLNEEQWQLARGTVTEHVRALQTVEEPATWRTVILWLTLLVAVFLAWHLVQMPRGR